MNHNAYVVMSGDRPITVTTTLEAAQHAATEHDSRHLPDPREYRWDERADQWELMFLGRSGRWNKVYTAVHRVPTA
ncbi:hypothetical protein [Kitasatospora sp. NPDC058478]|uniref:hypothetical protein n=1 Tax=unclassified Kitasatospora TaxID=2633591 RepID=UPI00365BC56C